jgi:hypothetical protein
LRFGNERRDEIREIGRCAKRFLVTNEYPKENRTDRGIPGGKRWDERLEGWTKLVLFFTMFSFFSSVLAQKIFSSIFKEGARARNRIDSGETYT